MLVCVFFLPLHARSGVQRAPGLPCVPLWIALRPLLGSHGVPLGIALRPLLRVVCVLCSQGGPKFLNTSGAPCRGNARLFGYGLEWRAACLPEGLARNSLPESSFPLKKL